MKVRYADEAFADLERIYAYIAQDNPRAASAVVNRVHEVAGRVAEFPRTGVKKSDEQGVFTVPLGRYPYVIYYSVEGGELYVLHVRHGVRSPPGKLKS